MPGLRDLLGFAICLVVGFVLSLIVTAIALIAELRDELRGGGWEPVDVRWMLAGSVAFAVACMVMRVFRASRAS